MTEWPCMEESFATCPPAVGSHGFLESYLHGHWRDQSGCRYEVSVDDDGTRAPRTCTVSTTRRGQAETRTTPGLVKLCETNGVTRVMWANSYCLDTTEAALDHNRLQWISWRNGHTYTWFREEQIVAFWEDVKVHTEPDLGRASQATEEICETCMGTGVFSKRICARCSGSGKTALQHRGTTHVPMVIPPPSRLSFGVPPKGLPPAAPCEGEEPSRRPSPPPFHAPVLVPPPVAGVDIVEETLPAPGEGFSPHFCIFQGDPRGFSDWSTKVGNRHHRWDIAFDTLLRCVMMDGRWPREVKASVYAGADAVHVTGAIQPLVMPICGYSEQGKPRYAPVTVQSWEESLWKHFGKSQAGLDWEIEGPSTNILSFLTGRVPNRAVAQDRLLARLGSVINDAPAETVVIALDSRNADATDYEGLKVLGYRKQPLARTVFLLLGCTNGFDGPNDAAGGESEALLERILDRFVLRFGAKRVARVNLCDSNDSGQGAKLIPANIAAFVSTEYARGALHHVVAGLEEMRGLRRSAVSGDHEAAAGPPRSIPPTAPPKVSATSAASASQSQSRRVVPPTRAPEAPPPRPPPAVSSIAGLIRLDRNKDADRAAGAPKEPPERSHPADAAPVVESQDHFRASKVRWADVADMEEEDDCYDDVGMYADGEEDDPDGVADFEEDDCWDGQRQSYGETSPGAKRKVASTASRSRQLPPCPSGRAPDAPQEPPTPSSPSECTSAGSRRRVLPPMPSGAPPPQPTFGAAARHRGQADEEAEEAHAEAVLLGKNHGDEDETAQTLSQASRETSSTEAPSSPAGFGQQENGSSASTTQRRSRKAVAQQDPGELPKASEASSAASRPRKTQGAVSSAEVASTTIAGAEATPSSSSGLTGWFATFSSCRRRSRSASAQQAQDEQATSSKDHLARETHKAASAKRKPQVPHKHCPRNHGLKARPMSRIQTFWPGFLCDVCSDRCRFTETRWTCVQQGCDYDVCNNCHTQGPSNEPLPRSCMRSLMMTMFIKFDTYFFVWRRNGDKQGLADHGPSLLNSFVNNLENALTCERRRSEDGKANVDADLRPKGKTGPALGAVVGSRKMARAAQQKTNAANLRLDDELLDANRGSWYKWLLIPVVLLLVGQIALWYAGWRVVIHTHVSFEDAVRTFDSWLYAESSETVDWFESTIEDAEPELLPRRGEVRPMSGNGGRDGGEYSWG